MATVATFVILAFRIIYLRDETPILNNYIDGIGGAGGLADAAAKAEVVAESVGDIRCYFFHIVLKRNISIRRCSVMVHTGRLPVHSSPA